MVPILTSGASMKRILILATIACALALSPWTASAQQKPLAIKPLAEKKVAQLPAGALYWRIENVASLDAAKAATGEWGLAAEADGKVWLFTLGATGGSSGAGTKVGEVGPIPRVEA